LQTVTDTFFSHENNLFARLFKFLDAGDVLLADRNFCSYGNLSALLSKKVDAVMRMHQSRPADFRKGKALGKNHRLICWQKPTKKPRAMPQEQFDLLPAQITLRMLRLHISAPGFRTRTIVLVTTLLDTKLYPPEALFELYRRRWAIELFLRDIKTTMKMDVLRCKSPAMVQRELAMHCIGYKLEGKTLSIAISQQQYDQLRQAIANQNRLDKILAKMRSLTQEIIFTNTPGVKKRK
jgi:hypothetical protein